MVNQAPPPRIALIHAVTVAIAPVAAAFAERWPEAVTFNLLDDSLSADRAADIALSVQMTNRIRALARYAETAQADGILFTCSAFGPAIDAAARDAAVPVFKPNEAMFVQALGIGRRVAMLATFSPAVALMEAEFHALAAARGVDAVMTTHCLPEAMAALKAGDGERHDALLAEVAAQLDACDAILLAHFSTARARETVARVARIPVLTSPGAAVDLLRSKIEKATY